MSRLLDSDWRDTISKLSKSTDTVALALYDSDGKLIDANKSMCIFLDTTESKLNPNHFLVNPDIKKLKKLNPDNNHMIFDGLLTIGNYSDQSIVLNAKIYRKFEEYFIYAIPDFIDLINENKKMSRLNQKVNNLQHQLIKEKSKLEKTLDALKETQQMLVHSEKMNALGQMVAGVAHEINNPIAFVTNNLYELEKYFLEILDMFFELESKFNNAKNKIALKDLKDIKEKYEFDFFSEDVSEIITESKNGVERVKKIVEDLRRFSRLDESNLKYIDLIENINSTLSIVNQKISKKGINFEINTPKELFIHCFPGQLNQAILNILVNAIYAVDIEGKIFLKINEDKNTVVIIIEDDGIGITKNNLKKIFNPFFTTKPVGSGTGLGLSITYKIINDLHLGSIDVMSELGKGTTFKILIPKTLNNQTVQ